MIVIHIIVYLLSFFFVWLGSGWIVSSTEHFSKKLKISSFAVSFILLGMLTSTPEITIGLTSIMNNEPEIYIGNLLGGIPVIFMIIIPLLAIAGNGIKLKHDLNTTNLLTTLVVILLPSVLILDKKVTNLEGIIMIISYIVLLYMIERKHGFLDKSNQELIKMKAYSYKDLAKVIMGVALIFWSSQVIVQETEEIAKFFTISPFYISLILLSLGTNVPEISLAIRSVISGQKDVAFGDYMGSASANTFLFGVFALMTRGDVFTVTDFLTTFIFITTALTLFFLFSRTKEAISRVDGIILLGLYLIFVFYELAGK